MVLPISICKLDATNNPDAFTHVPDLVWTAPEPETANNKQKTLKKLKLGPEKQLGK